ncbi:snRNA-activating protein complex subunit 4 [Ostrinia furnacalis]|uniref:snRNA-activating protein complex subunit 4 n=1 Tax=Ostrinia furnacalis TaxID=93504 RepID=UPI00103F7D15|nr:snRNA-activating protein complex subunit 4 [Ostrinia furnacalis]
MDNDIESEDDDETQQLRDLQNLEAVLEDENAGSCATSRCSEPSIILSGGVRIPASSLDSFTRIETALALNKLTEMRLQRLEGILVNRFKQSTGKITEIQSSYVNIEKYTRPTKFSFISCGKPYFKDSHNFPAPDNSDTILMRKSGMYDFSCVASVPGWTVKDKSEFISSMLKMSKAIKIKELNSKLAEFRRDNNIPEERKSKLVKALQSEIKSVGKKSLDQLALPLSSDFDYDWETIANKLNHRHSPQEYASLWKLYMHPSINKECWTVTEHVALQRLAHVHRLQDWESVAAQLNTDRTGYQVFVYFRTNMTNTLSGNKWTKEEEAYLKRLIEFYREDNYIPWSRIAACMENRTKIQIYNKYLRLLELRKGRFLTEEDAVILTGIEKYGTNFKKIAEFLPGRSQSQLRYRYKVIAKQQMSTVWTISEDKKLMHLINKDGNSNFASIAKDFVGKDRVSIRARYITLMKWMKRNPNVDIIYAPRRGARRLFHGQATANLNTAIDDLKRRMESELETKKATRITKESTEEEIDDAIVATLTTIMVKEEEAHREKMADKLILEDDVVISHNQLNATNLQKCLILLKSGISKQQFTSSKYAKRYPELLIPEKQVSLVKVKSYSRKDASNTINIKSPPNIWGENVLTNTEYVFPPHYTTITGCRALLAHTSVGDSLPKVDLNLLKARNVLFKENMTLLMERFNSLFLWPMLLSNEHPNSDQMTEFYNPAARRIQPLLALPSTSGMEQKTLPTVKEQSSSCSKNKQPQIKKKKRK